MALDYAIHISKSSKAEITILHVIEDFPHVPVFSLHASQVNKIKKDMADVIKEMKIVMEKERAKRIETCKKMK